MNTEKAGLAIISVILFCAGPATSRVRAGLLTIVTEPTGLRVTVDGTNYAAPVTFDWIAGSTHALEVPSPQVADGGHSRALFAAWSDTGAQAHSITVPDTASTNLASFVTQYLLDTVVVPSGAGTVTNTPSGLWYNAGQLVSLSATTNTGYRMNYWHGADNSAGNAAQVTMNSYHQVQASFLPSDYPYIVVTNCGGAAEGNLIGSIDGRTADGTKLYYVILDGTGTNVIFASKTNTLYRFVTPQGFDAVAASGAFNLKDENLGVVGSIKTLGYTLDTHDIKILPNGHALVFGTEVRTVDMSALVTGGKIAASVTGDVIQEIDANKQLVFEWHTFDHIPVTNSFYDLTQQTIDYAHINSVTIDPTDNNLLASLRTTSEIVKINRQTGEVMWRLGGKQNEFTFVGEHQENAPYYTVGQHDVHRLANGNLLFFDNGNISGGGVTPNDRTYSRGVEYALDEVNKVATLVWEFRHTPDISATCTGSVERTANGNTLIGWGCAIPTSGVIATEVSPAGSVVFEIKHRTAPGAKSLMIGSGLTKKSWASPDLVRGTNYENVVAGRVYSSPEAGVSVAITGLASTNQNTLTIERHLDAVRFPQFFGKAPQVLMEHIVLSGSNLVSCQAELELDLPDTSYVFDTPIIHDAAQVVVYQRPVPGSGQFFALPTTYDAGRQKSHVAITQPGELIFAYPDLAEIPYTPGILNPANQAEVNQAAPVTLVWTPRGLVGSFALQIATDADFADLVLETNGLGGGSFVLQNPLPETHYFWRVRTVNEGGTSDWAAAAFTTVPPVLRLTYPAGGEVWQRFQQVTIRWKGNISENVALDIYKGGVSNRTFVASTPDTGSYSWTVGQFQAFPPGSDYTMKIRSTANSALYDFSAPFTIITNLTSLSINVGSLTNAPEGPIRFGFSVPGALDVTVLGSTNLLDWEVLRTVPLTNGAAVFEDDTATNFSCRFYRLRVP